MRETKKERGNSPSSFPREITRRIPVEGFLLQQKFQNRRFREKTVSGVHTHTPEPFLRARPESEKSSSRQKMTTTTGRSSLAPAHLRCIYTPSPPSPSNQKTHKESCLSFSPSLFVFLSRERFNSKKEERRQRRLLAVPLYNELVYYGTHQHTSIQVY